MKPALRTVPKPMLAMFLCLVTLTFEPFDSKKQTCFQDSSWHMSVSSPVILAALVCEVSCGKTDKHTDEHTNAANKPSDATAVRVGNKRYQHR